MQTPKVYWKRAGYVAIQDRSGSMVRFGGSKDSLDFRFEGEKVGDICPRFKVGILGLSKEHINQLTVWNPVEAITKARKIQVFAGYEKDSLLNPIFEGYVLNAMPTNPPEMWMNFDCIYGLGQLTQIRDQKVMHESLETIAKELAWNLDMKFYWASEKVDKDKKSKFVLAGSKMDCLRKFVDSNGLMVYNDGGILTFSDVRGWNGKVKRPTNISIDTGMLGLGNVSLKGAVIRRRLDDTAGLFSWVHLTSSIVPSANGDYYVIKKKHVGHFRGDDWYTELDTIRKG